MELPVLCFMHHALCIILAAQVRDKGYPPAMKTFNTKAEANRWARLVKSEMDHDAYVSREEAENTSFAEALDGGS